MSEIANIIEQLSPEKRELLEMLMLEDTGLQATYVAPSTPVEHMLATIWGQVLGIDQIGIHDHFLELGGDSIQSIQIVAKAHKAGLQLTSHLLFEYPTIAELATVIDINYTDLNEQQPVVGSIPLTPIQQWFFEQNFQEPAQWNQAVLLKLQPGENPALLKEVFQHLLKHHDALRLRFTQNEGIWQQINTGTEEKVAFSQFDLSKLAESAQKYEIERIATELQSSLNLSEGPLMKVAFFDLGANKSSRLLVIIHHLAVEAVVSFQILMEDIQTAFIQLKNKEAICLAPKTTSFQQWSRLLMEYAQSPELKKELGYWLSERRKEVQPLPVDYQDGSNIEASTRILSVSLTPEETDILLHQIPANYHIQINEVLLAALVKTISEWTGNSNVLIDLDSHGREEIIQDVDISRTVGWFTSLFPVLFQLEYPQITIDAIMSIARQLHEIPNRGIGYGLLRYCCEDEAIRENLRNLPQAEIMFNYLGQFDRILPESSPFKFANESCGPMYSPCGNRTHLLQVLGKVFAGQLQITWFYSENIYYKATIETLAQRFVEKLRSIIAQCK